MNTEIHIGELIQDILRESDHSVSWLARKMNCDRTNIYKLFENQHIDTFQLIRISLILGYNFFIHYSDFIKSVEKSITKV